MNISGKDVTITVDRDSDGNLIFTLWVGGKPDPDNKYGWIDGVKVRDGKTGKELSKWCFIHCTNSVRHHYDCKLDDT